MTDPKAAAEPKMSDLEKELAELAEHEAQGAARRRNVEAKQLPLINDVIGDFDTPANRKAVERTLESCKLLSGGPQAQAEQLASGFVAALSYLRKQAERIQGQIEEDAEKAKAS